MSYHQDLEKTTRDMHDACLEVEYMKKLPILNLILEKKNKKFKGGKRYYWEIDTDTTEDTAQNYGAQDTLTHQNSDTLDDVYFRRKQFQVPVTIDLDEELQNAMETEDRTQLHKLAKHKVKKCNEAGRLHLRKQLYASPNAGTGIFGTDTNKNMQGLNSALQLDATNITTYGEKTRSDTCDSTYKFWQPANDIYTKVNQETETNISIEWLQSVYDPIGDLETTSSDKLIIVGNALYMALRSEAQARSMPVDYDPAGNFKYGIEEMVIDGMRIVKEPFFQTRYNTIMGETTGSAHDLSRRLYILNMNDWYFYIHPKRNFFMTTFFDQSQIANGVDFTLARLKVAGNIICRHPNRQAYFANIIP